MLILMIIRKGIMVAVIIIKIMTLAIIVTRTMIREHPPGTVAHASLQTLYRMLSEDKDNSLLPGSIHNGDTPTKGERRTESEWRTEGVGPRVVERPEEDDVQVLDAVGASGGAVKDEEMPASASSMTPRRRRMKVIILFCCVGLCVFTAIKPWPFLSSVVLFLIRFCYRNQKIDPNIDFFY